MFKHFEHFSRVKIIVRAEKGEASKGGHVLGGKKLENFNVASLL